MKNRNLFLAAFLAVPFYLTSDNVIESDVNDIDNSEEEVVTEEVLAEDSVSSESEPLFTSSDDDVEEVVVTGSRIKKSTFTSIAPLQIINTDVSREAGLINAADILQESPSASGQQADLSFAGFNLDNGPGSSTISLRGLGAGRTLVLINGRRVGPAGVEGAPFAPDLNLLPSALVQRYELLLDGASSVYGSDAIAGVSNAILRKDFDGFEFEIYANDSPHDATFIEDYSLSFAYGLNFDRGFIGMAYETDYNQEVQYVDRPWTSDCTVDYEITQDGEIRTKNVFYEVQYGDYVLDCQHNMDVGEVATYLALGAWTISYQPGFDLGSTLDIDLGPNAMGWFPTSMGNAVDIDIDPRDGISDYSRKIFNTNGNDLHSSMYPEFERDSFMAYGEYTLDNAANSTLFFEYQKSKRETFSDVGARSLSPWVAADYDKNICNPDGSIGFDCSIMSGAVYSNPGFIEDSNTRYTNLYGAPPAAYGWYNVCPETTYGVLGWTYGGTIDAATAAACAEDPYIYAADGVTPIALNPAYYDGWNWGAVTSEIYFGLLEDEIGPEGGLNSSSVYCYFYGYYYGIDCQGNSGAIPVQPYVSIVGDRTAVRTEVEQDRLVLGSSGDIPMEINGFNDWTYEVSATRTESAGLSYRSGIRGDRLAFALGFDPSGPYGDDPTQGELGTGSYLTSLPNGPCNAEGSIGEIKQDVIDGCVLVNLFAPSVFEGVMGNFETQAERDYLFDESIFDTEITQDVFTAFATGTIMSAPAGDIAMVLGIERQTLVINSLPDFIADEGLLVDFTSNGGAKGRQVVKEGFFEFGVPILAGARFAEELNLEFSGRHTSTTNENRFNNTESTDSGKTYSVKMSYRPNEDLLFRATKGTAFRAPNLRETALRDEVDTINIYDYCYAPRGSVAIDTDSGQYTYFRDRDFRDEQTIANCIEAGLDPVELGHTLFTENPSQSSNPYSAQYITGGVVGLDSETSQSMTYGLVYDIPYAKFLTGYDGSQNTTIGITRYELEVNNSIIELSPAYINYQCYVTSTGLDSPFCDNITRKADGDIESITTGFLNRDAETANGVDVNILHTGTLDIFDNSYDFGVDITANTVRERGLIYTNAEGNVSWTNYATEPGFPEWNIFTRAFLEVNDFRISWQTNWLSRVDQDKDELDRWGSANGYGQEDPITGNRTLVSADTCYGITKDKDSNDITQVEVGDTYCRDVGFIKAYVTHNASVYYYDDNLTIGFGIRNVFDKEPPMVDPDEIDSKSNAPLGYGYSLNGRNFFFNVRYQF